MLSFTPTGWLGLVVASLVAAYMSTISTHLNWGSSYLVADFYQRFVRPGAEARLHPHDPRYRWDLLSSVRVRMVVV